MTVGTTADDAQNGTSGAHLIRRRVHGHSYGALPRTGPVGRATHWQSNARWTRAPEALCECNTFVVGDQRRTREGIDDHDRRPGGVAQNCRSALGVCAPNASTERHQLRGAQRALSARMRLSCFATRNSGSALRSTRWPTRRSVRLLASTAARIGVGMALFRTPKGSCRLQRAIGSMATCRRSRPRARSSRPLESAR
jgi:hypothetical protein